MSQIGLIEFKTNDELDAEEQARREAEARQNQPIILNLAAYVRTCWDAARMAKDPIERIMLKNLRRRAGEYEPDKLQKIMAHGGSAIYMMLTDEKCSAAEAWLEDILFPPDDEPWGIRPTPVPELAPEQVEAIKSQVSFEAQEEFASGIPITPQIMMERAKEIAEELKNELQQAAKEAQGRIEEKIKDVIVESDWKNALKDALWDLTTYPSAFIEGPIVRKRKSLVWDDNGTPSVQNNLKIEFEWASAWDIYPSPSSKKVGDGYLIRKYRLTRKKLADMRGVKGFDVQTINRVLDLYGRGGLRDWLFDGYETQRQKLENREHDDLDPEGRIDAIRFWGDIQGLMLLEYGLSPKEIPDPFDDYPAEVWMIGPYVIKAQINGDPLGRIPIHKTGFRKRNGAFWWVSMTELIEDSQDACNAAARNLINNAGIASGPQVGVDSARLPAGEKVEDMYPWKIWEFDMEGAADNSRPPIWFFQPKIMVEQLLKIYEFFSAECDNRTGFPKYSYGGQQKGVGALSTATGFSMMMSNLSRGVKKVVSNIDSGWIEPSINLTHEFLMLYGGDPDLLRGDIKMMAKGSSSLVAKEQQQIRRNEFFQVILHPTVGQVLTNAGVYEIFLIELLRKIAAGLDIDTDTIPTPQQIKMAQMAMAAQQNQVAAGNGDQRMIQAEATNPAGDRVAGQDFRTV